MKYGDFRKIMEQRDIKGAYLFMGEEGLVIEKTIDYIVNTYIDETFKDFNYTFLNGNNLILDNFYSYLETLPFMSSKRVVIINELQDFQSRFNLNDLFFETVEGLPDDTIVIFYDSEQNLKKNTQLYKFFKKINRVVEFGKLNNYEVSNFLKRELMKNDKFISDGDLSYFIMLTGYLNKKVEMNLYDVETELEKLISYSTDSNITREDIDKTIKKANDSDIFNLLNSLADKKPGDALRYLHDLYDKNEPIPSLLYMIQRRYRHMYEYFSLYKDMKRDDEIKKIVGITSDYEFKIVSQLARGRDLCELKYNLASILEVDKKLKSTSHDKLLLMEYLVVNICK